MFPSSSRLDPIGLAGDEGPFLETLPPPEGRRFPWHLLLLLVLTVLAGASRFYLLDHPPIWGDEASTFRRVSGTYEQMLQTLELDPFGPLFYEAEWAVRQIHPLMPFWLRLFPAVCGTLMVPAMYFLTRQVASIRTAIAVTLFTLCSSWIINYGRDAKIYMPLYLFTALSAACFLWWIRSRTWTAWLSWIAASCAMVGVDVRAAIILALAPVWMLVSRRVHWSMGAGLVIGFLVIASGPVGYYRLFNHWQHKVEESGRMPDISWVPDRNGNATGLEMAQDSASAFLYSFTFIQESAGRPQPPQAELLRATLAFTAIMTLLVIGALPWRHPITPPLASAPEPWWRPTIWLGSWITVATYIFYCMSVKEAASPHDWLASWQSAIGWNIWLITRLTFAVAALTLWKRRTGTVLLLGLIGLTTVVFLIAVHRVYAMDIPDAEKWHRLIDVAALWPVLLNRLGTPTEGDGIVTHIYYGLFRVVPIGMVIVGGIAFARSGRTYRQRLGQIILVALIAAGTAFVLTAIYDGCESAKANMRASGVEPTSIWVPRYLGFIWPAVAIVVISLLMRLPTWPLRWTAVLALCALNLFVAQRRVLGATETPIDRMAAELHASAAKGSTLRAFIRDGRAGSGPGGGELYGIVGRYYLANLQPDMKLSPDIVEDDGSFEDLRGDRNGQNPSRIALAAKNSPTVNRVIVWRPFYRDNRVRRDEDIPPPINTVPDQLLTKLGPDWRLTADEILPVRYHWCWAEMYLYQRREYVKGAPTTQPTRVESTTRPTDH